MDKNTSPFSDFWEASSLNRFNVQEFASRLSSYDSDGKTLMLDYPQAPTPLPKARSQLNKIAGTRVSSRSFSAAKLSVKELSLLLSSFRAWNGLEHRGYPSAGATYVTEIFCIAFNVESHSGNVLYYDPENHAVVVVSDHAPTWDEAARSLNMTISGAPQLLVLLAIFPERAIAKYGERGGRFALMEGGAAMQQLALQIAGSPKLKGVAVGGALDPLWKQVVGLDDTDAHIALGYLVGK